MSKDKIQLLSPLFLKYQADFEKNPRSRVFAPLAETYRKLGMTDKAMEILSQGIRYHPTYVMGYLGLAFCYFDLGQFSLAYSTLRPLVETSRDNIRLQKLFAEICIEQGHKEEALDTYKYLLFINPRDKDVAFQVSTLERSIEEKYKTVHRPIYIPESEFKTEIFDVAKLESDSDSDSLDFDDWMALDLSRKKKQVKKEDPYELWNLKKGDAPLALLEDKKIVIEEASQSIEELVIVLDLNTDEAPLVTHTLVDLYCGQGHIEKALEVLEKILILNPRDEKTIKKISEIKSLMGKEEEQFNVSVTKKQPIEENMRPPLEVLQETSEEDGRKNLMSIFDQQIKHVEVENIPENKPIKRSSPRPNHDKKRLIEEKLSLFLKKIQKRALDYQARSW